MIHKPQFFCLEPKPPGAAHFGQESELESTQHNWSQLQDLGTNLHRQQKLQTRRRDRGQKNKTTKQ